MADSERDTAVAESELPGRIAAELREGLGGGLVSVVLFGSRARGEARESSDWDVLVVARDLPERTLERSIRIRQMLSPDYRAEVSLLAKTPDEFTSGLPDLYLDIASDGRILYDTGGYVEQRLGFVKRLIRRKGLRREREDGDLMWRWENPPDAGWSLKWEEAAR